MIPKSAYADLPEIPELETGDGPRIIYVVIPAPPAPRDNTAAALLFLFFVGILLRVAFNIYQERTQ